MLVGTKEDKKQNNTIHVAKYDGERLALKMNCQGYYETSALTGFGVKEIFKDAIRITFSYSYSRQINITFEAGSDILHQILYLVRKPNGIDSLDKEGNTVLHIAAANTGDTHLMKCLLSVGASLKITNNQGKKPEDVANERTREYFQNSDTNENVTNMFLHSVETGHTAVVEIMMACQVELIYKVDREGNTAFHLASKYNREKVFKVLLLRSHITIFNQKNNNKETPLSLALENGNEKMIGIIMNHISQAMSNEEEFKTLQENFGKGKNMLHIQKCNNKNESLLQFILNRNPSTLKEREIVIDLLRKIDMERYPMDLKNSEFRVLEQLRTGIHTSEKYSNCLESAQERFSWSKSKMWGMRFWSIILNFTLGVGLYAFDFGTDVKFAVEMFEMGNKNFSMLNRNCQLKGTSILQNVNEVCQSNFGTEECYEAFNNATRFYCFKNEQVFLDLTEWKRAGTALAVHGCSPIIFSIIVLAFVS